ncbi:MAG: chemotaxis-specific protein-glutamate methyltransferase CheB [Helicobacteraceae bacterium]|jgi:two-component system chemotaxis response regulator CheB|nr:chemotaxis-specific protein-glutamate methyltransferase CheB [Helicobacteraceae bacterium]
MGVTVLIAEFGGGLKHGTAREILKKDPQFTIAATVKDIFSAHNQAEKIRPDLICLDYETQQVDYAPHLRKLAPLAIPVLIYSPLNANSAKLALEAITQGAIDFVVKPRDYGLAAEKEFVDKIRGAAKSKIGQPNGANRPKPPTSLAQYAARKKIIAIGASTGGTEALKEVLIRMPKNSPAIVIVQHMPANFTGPFAQRLDSLCQIKIKEAQNGDEALVNQALIAPGDRHMFLRRNASGYFVEIADGEKISGHRPSVDALFESVAQYAGASAVGVILTGMGGDGARGLLKMHEAGAKTVAQDEKTCVVFGMPKVAIELGAVDRIAPLEAIPAVALQFAAEIA